VELQQVHRPCRRLEQRRQRLRRRHRSAGEPPDESTARPRFYSRWRRFVVSWRPSRCLAGRGPDSGCPSSKKPMSK
jgi:hypothetical protein